MTAMVTMRPDKRGRRPHKRRTFRGELRAANGNVSLSVRRGCFLRIVDKEGGVVVDDRDDEARLLPNIGDKLILTHTALEIDEVVMVEVVGIQPSGWIATLLVRLFVGSALPSSSSVYVMPAQKAEKLARDRARRDAGSRRAA